MYRCTVSSYVLATDVKAAPISLSLLSATSGPSGTSAAEHGAGGGLVVSRCRDPYCSVFTRVQSGEAHTCKCEQHLFNFLKSVWGRVGLHLVYNDSHAICKEVPGVIVGERVVLHLALLSAGGIVCRSFSVALSP